ncbi:U3 small nucleolar RNA-associated 14-B-like protein [Striga asiatica]|uniref:U3 small nucleolar RNA-associated 14-B-like protein n=1 Tax=Striga asiatica TaxID=4170 RepID=A0A5A7PWX9_STRAF|nr:U3 small nucleolar RNA-associated 14-B-like protein [Striga asiatica]
MVELSWKTVISGLPQVTSGLLSYVLYTISSPLPPSSKISVSDSDHPAARSRTSASVAPLAAALRRHVAPLRLRQTTYTPQASVNGARSTIFSIAAQPLSLVPAQPPPSLISPPAFYLSALFSPPSSPFSACRRHSQPTISIPPLPSPPYKISSLSSTSVTTRLWQQDWIQGDGGRRRLEGGTRPFSLAGQLVFSGGTRSSSPVGQLGCNMCFDAVIGEAGIWSGRVATGSDVF